MEQWRDHRIMNRASFRRASHEEAVQELDQRHPRIGSRWFPQNTPRGSLAAILVGDYNCRIKCNRCHAKVLEGDAERSGTGNACS